jgi:hypothetical protein
MYISIVIYVIKPITHTSNSRHIFYIFVHHINKNPLALPRKIKLTPVLTLSINIALVTILILNCTVSTKSEADDIIDQWL